LIFTAAEQICSFLITKTRSPKSEGAYQAKYVNYWIHNGFVNIDKEKMSKSLGNFFTIREALKKYDAEVPALSSFWCTLSQSAALF